MESIVHMFLILTVEHLYLCDITFSLRIMGSKELTARDDQQPLLLKIVNDSLVRV